MTNLVLIVEGHGDVDAFPPLVGKVGGWLELPLFTKSPIRTGGWGAIKKPGGLEKWVGLAVSREGCSRIVIVTDLDDACPVDERASVEDRVMELSSQFGVSIDICFCMREFESWLLHSFPEIEEKFKNIDTKKLQKSASFCDIRDAKGLLRRAMVDGYSESSDQKALASAIFPPTLFNKSRSFRRFVKVIAQKEYVVLQDIVNKTVSGAGE